MTKPNSYSLAEIINKKVNLNTTYRSDLQQFGVPEHWTVAGRYGDCEDYALAKRQALLASGWPIDCLGLIVCKDETGTGHCVLWVMTERGSYILDNRFDAPVPPKSLNYQWESMLCNGQWQRLVGWSS